MDIKQIAVELLEVLKQGLASGSKVVSEQFPILCQQILQWGIINNICTILLSIFMIISCYYLTIFGIKKRRANDYDGEVWYSLIVPSILVGMFFIICFWVAIFEISKIISAPNVYLLNYFGGLVSPKQ